MASDPAAVDVHDVAGLQRTWLEALDDARVAARRHEANVLAVGLFCNGEAKLVRERTHLGLAHRAEGKAQVAELLGCGGEQEIALVTLGIGGARKLRPARALAPLDVVACRQCIGAEVLCRLEQVAKLDLLIAGDARDRRLARGIALRKAAHHRVGEAALIIEHVVGDAQHLGDAARIVDVLAGAAASLPARRLAVIVELQRDADDLVALALHERGGDGGIHASRHGDDDAGLTHAVWGRRENRGAYERGGADQATDHLEASTGRRPNHERERGTSAGHGGCQCPCCGPTYGVSGG